MFGHRSQTNLSHILHRPRPSVWQRLWEASVVFLSSKLYQWRLSHFHQKDEPNPNGAQNISVVCISDTHNSQPKLPNGDILIHAGDLTQSGTFEELQATLDWLRSQPHPHKIVIAGNHDLLLDSSLDHKSPSNAQLRARLNWGDITYLENTSTTIHVQVHPSSSPSSTDTTTPTTRSLKIFGSPYTPRHGNWAFQYPRPHNIWSPSSATTSNLNLNQDSLQPVTIPHDTSILVTHGPPRAHLDLLSLGCVHLLDQLWRVRPLLHVFGHGHGGYGVEGPVVFDGLQGAYERAVCAGGGEGNFVRVVSEFGKWLFGWGIGIGLGIGGRGDDGVGEREGTVLVNAAVVGGLRDDERRRPVVVWI